MNKRIGKVVLLADDDFDDAEIFGDVLADIDPQIEFHHEKDGLGLFTYIKSMQSSVPDLIFLDLNMPEMDGWQCLTQLKAHPLTKDIPVLIYSTSSLKHEKQTAMEAGAAAFITKPSDYKSLQKILSIIALNPNQEIGRILNNLA